MPGFEGAAGPAIFATGQTVTRDPGKKIGTGLLIGGLLTGGAPATLASYAISITTAYDVLTPLIPAFFTKTKGDYGGKEYEAYYGFGYEEHLAAKHHPATAWFMQRHMTVWGRKSPWSAVQIPTFGFGWGSRIVEAESSSSSYQQNGGSPRQKSSDAPGGTSPITPRGPHRGFGGKTAGGSKKARGRRAPYCWVQ